MNPAEIRAWTARQRHTRSEHERNPITAFGVSGPCAVCGETTAYLSGVCRVCRSLDPTEEARER